MQMRRRRHDALVRSLADRVDGRGGDGAATSPSARPSTVPIRARTSWTWRVSSAVERAQRFLRSTGPSTSAGIGAASRPRAASARERPCVLGGNPADQCISMPPSTLSDWPVMLRAVVGRQEGDRVGRCPRASAPGPTGKRRARASGVESRRACSITSGAYRPPLEQTLRASRHIVRPQQARADRR